MIEDYHEYGKCYKCGAEITDAYPSHLCLRCRQNLTAPSEKTLADRLTAADIKMLHGMNIAVTPDMLKKT
jgi:hypothetical protein